MLVLHWKRVVPCIKIFRFLGVVLVVVVVVGGGVECF